MQSGTRAIVCPAIDALNVDEIGPRATPNHPHLGDANPALDTGDPGVLDPVNAADSRKSDEFIASNPPREGIVVRYQSNRMAILQQHRNNSLRVHRHARSKHQYL